MKYKILFLMLVLLVVSLNPAYAGNELRIGSAGAQELRIPVGARSSALSGAVIADVAGTEAIFWNPAGLARLGGTEVMFSHQPYIADINVNALAVATWIEGFGVLGTSAKIVSIGDMEETTEDFPGGTGRVYSPTLSVFSLSYARILTGQVSVGFNALFINEKVFEVSASGIAFDVGVTFDPDWNGLLFGAVLKNYGPEMTFSGNGFNRSLDGARPARPISAKFDLPSSINFGTSYQAVNQEQHLVTFSGNFQSNNYSQDVYQGGMEYVYDGKFSGRIGYNYADQTSYLYGVTIGAGLKQDIGGTLFSIDYSWNDTGEIFDANQFFTFKVLF